MATNSSTEAGGSVTAPSLLVARHQAVNTRRQTGEADRPLAAQRLPIALGPIQLIFIIERSAGAEFDPDEIHLNRVLIGPQWNSPDCCFAPFRDWHVAPGRSDCCDVDWCGQGWRIRFRCKSRGAHRETEPDVASPVSIGALKETGR
jgi:hypothetical protein